MIDSVKLKLIKRQKFALILAYTVGIIMFVALIIGTLEGLNIIDSDSWSWLNKNEGVFLFSLFIFVIGSFIYVPLYGTILLDDELILYKNRIETKIDGKKINFMLTDISKLKLYFRGYRGRVNYPYFYGTSSGITTIKIVYQGKKIIIRFLVKGTTGEKKLLRIINSWRENYPEYFEIKLQPPTLSESVVLAMERWGLQI